MEKSWVEGYYEALEFYYWEPQHIGRQRDPSITKNRIAEILNGLRRKEVPLNHIIKQFFSLAPTSLRNRLFEFALKSPTPNEFRMVGREAFQLYSGGQPDFLFTSEDQTVALEMKIDSKVTTEQVLKYAFVALALESGKEMKMRHSLIFLGLGDFCDLWKRKEKIASVEDLQSSLNVLKHPFAEKRLKKHKNRESRFFEIVSSLSIGCMSYSDLSNFLIAERDGLSKLHNFEVYENLLNGLIQELRARKLHEAIGRVPHP